jgi:hypothetical protein
VYPRLVVDLFLWWKVGNVATFPCNIGESRILHIVKDVVKHQFIHLFQYVLKAVGKSFCSLNMSDMEREPKPTVKSFMPRADSTGNYKIIVVKI